MTALNVLRTPTAVHLFSDGLAKTTEEDGNEPLGGFNKVLLFPHLSAAVAASGWAFMVHALHMSFNIGPASFDDLRSNIVHLIEGALQDYRILWKRAPKQDFRILVVGWSEKIGPSSYIVTNIASDGVPAWTPTDTGDFAMAPGTPELEAKILSAMPHVSCIEDFDAERDGLTILKMQRRAYPKDVGAFAQLTTVRPGEISTKILHRWPLKLGLDEGRQAKALSLRDKYCS